MEENICTKVLGNLTNFLDKVAKRKLVGVAGTDKPVALVAEHSL